MEKSEVRINSYFPFPTDLASSMSGWSEFVRGDGYEVDLLSSDGQGMISVRFVENDDDEIPYISITAPKSDPFFERVVGKVLLELGKHSDNLMVNQTIKDGA